MPEKEMGMEIPFVMAKESLGKRGSGGGQQVGRQANPMGGKDETELKPFSHNGPTYNGRWR